MCCPAITRLLGYHPRMSRPASHVLADLRADYSAWWMHAVLQPAEATPQAGSSRCEDAGMPCGAVYAKPALLSGPQTKARNGRCIPSDIAHLNHNTRRRSVMLLPSLVCTCVAFQSPRFQKVQCKPCVSQSLKCCNVYICLRMQRCNVVGARLIIRMLCAGGR